MATRLVRFDYSRPVGGPSDVPISGRGALTAQLVRREVVDGRIRVTESFPIDLVDGIGSTLLSVTPPNQAWRITEGRPIPKRRIWTKAVPAGASPIWLSDLPDVDPDTFDPLEAVPPSAADLLTLAEAKLQEVLDRTPEANLAAHRDDPAPHPAYDDMESLSLLFENGLI